VSAVDLRMIRDAIASCIKDVEAAAAVEQGFRTVQLTRCLTTLAQLHTLVREAVEINEAVAGWAEASAAAEGTSRIDPPYGPGAICEDCGHFAGRHAGLACLFPPESLAAPNTGQPCPCAGMAWGGLRFEMDPRTGAISSVNEPAAAGE